jgi:hypothetical protein
VYTSSNIAKVFPPSFPPLVSSSIPYISHLLTASPAKARTLPNTPVPKGPAFKNALVISLTLGLATCCCVEALNSNNGNRNVGGGGGGGQQMGGVGNGAFVTQPQPAYQPNVDWGTLQGAASDPIQG